MRRALALALLLAGCAANMPAPMDAPAVDQTGAASEARNSAKVHTDLGMLYLQAGNLATALQEGRIALRRDAGYAPAHNLVGLAHLFLGEQQAAGENLERALRLAPTDPDINNSYGWYLCLRGQERRGIQHLMAAANNPLYKTPTRPYTNAGLCSLSLKDDKAAREHFQRAVMADPGNTQAMYHLADLAYRGGDYYRAKKILSDLHRLSEPTPASLWLGVRIERKAGDRQAEATYASQLRRKFAGSPEYQLLTQGRYE